MKKNKKQMNEGVLDSSQDDGWTAKSQLYKLAQYSIELHKMIQDDQQLPAWIQTKIARASDDLSSVKHYMEYDQLSPQLEPEPEFEESLYDDVYESIEDQANAFYTSIKSKINSQAPHNKKGMTEGDEACDFKVEYKNAAGETKKKKVKATGQEEAMSKCKEQLPDGCTVLSARQY